MCAEEPKTAISTTIRTAEAADLNQVYSLTVEFATSFQPNIEFFRTSFRRLIDHRDALFLVAVQSGLVAGYLLGFDHDSLFANGRVAWLEELIVRQQLRRKGIGKQLTERFEQWARSRANRLVALGTRRAALFYRAIGYEESAMYLRKLLQ